jgi:hypothetical protein
VTKILQDKVLDGLEKVSELSGHTLEVYVERTGDQWSIRFKSGNAQIRTLVSTFIQQPKIVLDPFVDEIIKKN